MIGDSDGMQWREAENNSGEATKPEFECAFYKGNWGLDKYAMCNSVGAIIVITRHIDGGLWIETMCDDFDPADEWQQINELQFMDFYHKVRAELTHFING